MKGCNGVVKPSKRGPWLLYLTFLRGRKRGGHTSGRRWIESRCSGNANEDSDDNQRYCRWLVCVSEERRESSYVSGEMISCN